MNDLENAQWAGIKIVYLIFGFFGSALGLTFTPVLTKRLAVSAILAGLFCGAFGPELVTFLYDKPIPKLLTNFMAAIFGMGGMFIVPGILKVWEVFRDDPFGWLDRVRNLRGKDDGK